MNTHMVSQTKCGKTMLFGLGKRLGRPANRLSAEALAGLGPYADLPAAELQAALQQVETTQVNPGLLKVPLPPDRQTFLQRGSVQVQTRSGTMSMLRAGTAQARYPMPRAQDVVSLLATEPCTFVSLPLSFGKAHKLPRQTRMDPMQLTVQENTALTTLRHSFRSRQRELPSLPDLALKIGRAMDDPETTNEDIARLIQLDPALTARLVSVVNSAAFGGLSKITSVQQAAARLGRKKVRSLVYSCLLKSIFKVPSPTLKRRMEALWQHSASVAALSFVLGRATPGIDPEQALLAGLIHDIGAISVIGGIGEFPILAEREQVLDHVIADLRVEAGIQTLTCWGLQDELQDVVEHAEDWLRMGSAIPDNTDVVILAQLHALIGSPRQARLPRVDEVPAFCKLVQGELTPSHSLRILDEAAADVREVHSLISSD